MSTTNVPGFEHLQGKATETSRILQGEDFGSLGNFRVLEILMKIGRGIVVIRWKMKEIRGGKRLIKDLKIFWRLFEHDFF